MRLSDLTVIMYYYLKADFSHLDILSTKAIFVSLSSTNINDYYSTSDESIDFRVSHSYKVPSPGFK